MDEPVTELYPAFPFDESADICLRPDHDGFVCRDCYVGVRRAGLELGRELRDALATVERLSKFNFDAERKIRMLEAELAAARRMLYR